MALSPWYGLAFALLLIGGLGTAVFSNMQTSLILIEAPPTTRSRVMGIVTMCIGTGPLGVLVIGALSERLGPAGGDPDHGRLGRRRAEPRVGGG